MPNIEFHPRFRSFKQISIYQFQYCQLFNSCWDLTGSAPICSRHQLFYNLESPEWDEKQNVLETKLVWRQVAFGRKSVQLVCSMKHCSGQDWKSASGTNLQNAGFQRPRTPVKGNSSSPLAHWNLPWHVTALLVLLVHPNPPPFPRWRLLHCNDRFGCTSFTRSKYARNERLNWQKQMFLQEGWTKNKGCSLQKSVQLERAALLSISRFFSLLLWLERSNTY